MIEIVNLKIRIPELFFYLIVKFILFLKWLFIGLFALALTAWIIWIIGRIFRKTWYFPTCSICKGVHDSLPNWWKKAINLLSFKPNVATVGFLATLLWPFFIALNLFFLAQIFELFLPVGERVKTPLGIYYQGALFAGVLWALAQSFFGILHGYVKSKKGKIGVFILAGIAILAEMGLAYYRARLLTTGEELISPSIWDKMMIVGGPIFAAFLGFIIPLAETLSGRYAILEFIDPMLKGVLKWVGGLISVIWCFLSWLILGFHPIYPVCHEVIHIPKWVNTFGRRIGKLKGRINKLKENLNTLPEEIERINGLKEKIRNPEELGNDLKELEDQFISKSFSSMEEKWNGWVKEKEEEIKKSNNYSELKKIEQELKIKKREFILEIENAKTKLGGVVMRIKRGPKKVSKARKLLLSTENKLGEFKDEKIIYESEVSNIIDEIENALSTYTNYKNQPSAEECKRKMGEYKNELESIKETFQRLENLINTREKELNDLKNKIPDGFPEPTQRKLIERVLNIEKSLDNLKWKVCEDINRLKMECKKQKIQIRELEWFHLFLPWNWVVWAYQCAQRKASIQNPTKGEQK